MPRALLICILAVLVPASGPGGRTLESPSRARGTSRSRAAGGLGPGQPFTGRSISPLHRSPSALRNRAFSATPTLKAPGPSRWTPSLGRTPSPAGRRTRGQSRSRTVRSWWRSAGAAIEASSPDEDVSTGIASGGAGSIIPDPQKEPTSYRIRKNNQRKLQRNRQQPEEQRKTSSSLFLWLLSVPLYPMLFRIRYQALNDRPGGRFVLRRAPIRAR
jgi:hypothetical protein